MDGSFFFLSLSLCCSNALSALFFAGLNIVNGSLCATVWLAIFFFFGL